MMNGKANFSKEKNFRHLFSFFSVAEKNFSLRFLQSGNQCAYIAADNQAKYSQTYQDHNLLLRVSNNFMTIQRAKDFFCVKL